MIGWFDWFWRLIMGCETVKIECVICGTTAEVCKDDLWDNYGAYSNPTGQVDEVPCELSRENKPGWRLGKFMGPQGWAYNPVCEKCAVNPVIPYLEGFVPEAITAEPAAS